LREIKERKSNEPKQPSIVESHSLRPFPLLESLDVSSVKHDSFGTGKKRESRSSSGDEGELRRSEKIPTKKGK